MNEQEVQARLQQIEQQQAEIARLRLFYEAIDSELVCTGVYRAEHETNPRQAMADIIAWNQRVALDPAVSPEAAKLHEEIARLQAERDEARKDRVTAEDEAMCLEDALTREKARAEAAESALAALREQVAQKNPFVLGRGTPRCFWCNGWERHPHMDEDYYGKAGHKDGCLFLRAIPAGTESREGGTT